MRDCSVSSAAEIAASLADDLDPEDPCPPLRRGGAISDLLAELRSNYDCRRGGDQPQLTSIDNDIASRDIAFATPFGITKTTVRFPPN
jgi:hypothetical protein